MKKRPIKSIVALLCLSLIMHVSIHAQDSRITVTVSDENGQPIAGALVTIGEGAEEVFTDESGNFSLQVKTRTPVLIEAEGYESRIAYAMPPPVGMGSVVLLQRPYQMGEKAVVHVPFGTLKNRQLTGSATVITADELLKYDQQQNVFGLINGRVPGMFGANNIRGNGNPLIIVDGVPRSASDINIQAVDQIVVLKDLASGLMYGAQASNGVIIITTKRGQALKRNFNVIAENGFNTPVSYPNYLNSADYMGLYNEARVNDGLAPVYSETAIENTRSGVDGVLYPNEDYYNSTYLRDWTTSHRVVADAGGGNEVARYYLNMGWNRTNSLLNLGEGRDEKRDVLNLRGNVDYRLNDNLSIIFDGAFVLGLEKGARNPNGDFWSQSTSLLPNYSPTLIPVGRVQDADLLSGAKIIDGQYILGGSSEFSYNPYGDLLFGGNRNTVDRLMRLNTGINYNLNDFIYGLSASGYLSFDIFNGFNEHLPNTYAVYTPVNVSDSLYFNKIGNDIKVNDKEITNIDFYRRIGFYGSLNYNRVFNSIHHINANAVAYRDQFSEGNVFHPVSHLHFGLRTNYMFANKYIAEFTGVVAGSSKLFGSNRYAFSPGVGLGWVLSEEGFLADNSLIDYLKLRANWAVNHTDESTGYYLYLSNFYLLGPNWSFNQGNASNRARVAYNGNTTLDWENNMEINLGFEAELLNRRLMIDAGYFYSKSSDLISTRSNYYPMFFSSGIYENFGSEEYQGGELGLNFRESFGDFTINLGGNLVYSVPKVLKTDELNFDESTQSLRRTGRPSDAMFGYVALGLFRDNFEIENSPIQTFGTVRPGDIRYADLNGDGIISELDQQMIGNSQSRLGYGLNLRINFKALELFALGTGQNGGNTIYRNAYYWVYGDRKYSEVVLDRWTEATAETATYPRLSTTESSNNFRNSTFWIQDRDWFRLHTVQLTYSLPRNTWIMKETRFYLRGNNLATFSKNKDKMELNIGSAPQFRQYSFGLTATF
jgi:TonB-linked SusC/RagA family outer membrane protein